MASELNVGSLVVGGGVAGNKLAVHQTDAGLNSYVHITHADTGSAVSDGLSVGLDDTGLNAAIRLREAGKLTLYTSNEDRLTIDSAGAVSIPSAAGTQIALTVKGGNNLVDNIALNVTNQAGDTGTNIRNNGQLFTSSLATFSNGIAVNGAAADAHSSIQNVNSLAMAHTTTTTFECPGGLFAIYDTGGYGALFFSDYSLATPTKVAGTTHFGVATGAIQITSATNDSTVTIDNQQGGTRTISIMVLGN